MAESETTPLGSLKPDTEALATAEKSVGEESRSLRMRDKVIVRVVSEALIPFILLFALYVQFHGDYGPGGGFQAGVIFASGMILYSLVFGLRSLKKVVRLAVIRRLMGLGVLIYAGVGVASMLKGGNFLEYGALMHHDEKHAQHLGILLVEAGVGLTVAATLVGIFFVFAGRRRIDREVK